SSTLQSPTHTYTSVGTYTVALTATGPGGSDGETKVDYILVADPPVADFTGSPLSGVWPLTVTFTDMTSGNVTAWSWDFGDSGTSVGQNPTHVYTATGVYTVTLTATGPGGSDPETKTDYVTVSDPPPAAMFVGMPLSGTKPLTVSFTDQTTGPVTGWAWNFGDAAASTLQDPPHTYTAIGTYTVSLTATGPGGMDLETKVDYIVVSRPPPPKTRVNESKGDVSRTFEAPGLSADPSVVNFGAVAAEGSAQLTFDVFNPGWDSVVLTKLSALLGPFGTTEAFTLDFNGETYSGSNQDQSFNLSPPIVLGVDDTPITATLTFAPTAEQFDSFNLRFAGNWRNTNLLSLTVPVSGLGGHEADPFLHVVIDGEEWVADFDGDGTEAVTLRGDESHTHEPGMSIVGHEWEIDGMIVSTSDTLNTTLPVGAENVLLRIIDDDTPPKTLTDTFDVEVVSVSNIPGTLTTYYDGQETGASLLLDTVPAAPDFRERLSSFSVGSIGGFVGGSPFSQDVMVQLEGELALDAPASYEFFVVGGFDSRLELGGIAISGPQNLMPGIYSLEARIAVGFLNELPLDVTMSVDGGAPASIDEEIIRHDESSMPPILHSLVPSTGTTAGGNTVVIDGFGFFPSNEVVLHWGNSDFTQNDFQSFSSTQIVFVTPPGGGLIGVNVQTNQGTTPTRPFTYLLDGPVPIDFQLTHTFPLGSPTNAAWGPDGNLYVARLTGQVTAFEFDESYDIVSQTTYPGVSALSNHDLIGIAFSPYDPPDPVRLYLGHGEHYANGGTPPTKFSPYSGQISTLDGPDFDTPVPLITGLPVSNHDHAINQIAFDNNGDLLICAGSATNAGVIHPNHGGLPESPLSAAILKAKTSKPGFNGTITYVETISQIPNNDQRFGGIVDVVPGVDVEIQGAGLRNPYGLVFTTDSRVYATDNGPNTAFGEASTGPMTQDPAPFDSDEINLIEWGNYYGSPNRNRGRTDFRQNVYYGSLSGPPSIADTFMQMIGWSPPSSDGIDEYRSHTFQGQIRGDLIIQEYLSKLRRVSLLPDGRGLSGQFTFEPNTSALSCVTCPGGAILSLDYGNNEIEVFEPDDLSATGLVVHDVFPWRGPAAGGTPFVISGVGFGTLADTSVTFGGNVATLTEVSSKRIRGIVPTEVAPTTDLVDIEVTVDGITNDLTEAYRYLYGPGIEPGRWEMLDPVPAALGEVTAGVIEGTMYVVGEGTAQTYRYDCLNRQWLNNVAVRTFAGHHHSGEVVDGKWYLIGGLNGGSEGKVQIYDPVTDQWSLGADMPWGAGSVSTAVIDDKIYAAGGILSTFTVGTSAVYDPAMNDWTLVAQMPDGGRNHAAAETDGNLLYIFSGRKGGNFVSNGFEETFVYDPVGDTWDWSGAGGSLLAPIPEARGGIGKAIYLRGEFYVFGGETLNDPDANPDNVYDRVDVYDPLTNTWRVEQPLLNPRHGIYPVLFQGHMFLPGGGTTAGFALSTICDTFTRQ
ncbi:MAG: hypothetical protein CMJ89_08670, partial [Planctomycetes bacterium]|nr:hypothetical protein [Planctomycetota bacterium]